MTKVRIRLAAMEVEYDGEPEFLASGFYELLERLQDLAAKAPAINECAAPSDDGARATLQLTVKTIATKLDASSGPEVALAAMASLHLVKKMPKYKRSEILTEMKAATGIYKPSMSGNLSSHLQSLLSEGKIVEAETNVYALTPATEVELGQKLAAQ